MDFRATKDWNTLVILELGFLMLAGHWSDAERVESETKYTHRIRETKTFILLLQLFLINSIFNEYIVLYTIVFRTE